MRGLSSGGTSMSTNLPLTLAAILACCCAAVTLAQEAADRPQANPQEENQASPLPGYIRAVEVEREGADKPVAPTARALYSYADPARVIAEGAIWAWGEPGRPLAMAKCWRNRNGTQTVAFSLTSDELVVARGLEGTVWRPMQTQVAAAELAGA